MVTQGQRGGAASGLVARSGEKLSRLGALGVVVAVTLCVGAGSGASGPSAVVLSSSTGRTVVTARLGGKPTRIVWGEGAFWVVTPVSGAVVRIEPSGSVQRRSFRGEPYDAATGAGMVWVPRHDAFDLLGLEWKLGRERRSVILQTPQLAVGYGFGAVWTVGADGALRRIDPRTLRVTGTVGGVSFSSEGFEPRIAVARDALWVSDAVRHAVTRVDPRRLRVSAVVSHGGNGVAVAGAQVWSTDGSFAWRVAGGPIRRVRTGGGAYDVAAGGGAIWVANRFSRTVAKLDPERGTVVRTVRLPGRPSVLAYGVGYVAVALF
jgi:DNA-binding beta-propeller fold protein YncE